MKTRMAAWALVLAVAPLTATRPAAQQSQAAAPPPTSASTTSTPPAQQVVPPSLIAPGAGPTRQFTGAPIDVDYQGADLREVLRSVADFGGINLVIDPSVPTNAKVDLSLKQVPWDQVLDVVIRTNQLSWDVNGNVVRVTTTELAQKELKAQQDKEDALRDQQAQASLKAEPFVINYAKGSDIEKFINTPGTLPPGLGKYTKAVFDERSNTLYVTSLPQAIEFLRPIIKQLDQPEAQVEIEARIVETDQKSARALGIQWGVNGQMSPALGNTTSLGFPNSVGVNGVAQDSTGKPATVGNSGSVVNLPATSQFSTATSGIGLSLGAINGAFNLDAQLTALEHAGKTKILSQPKVTTQNNVPAEVTQGTTVPYQAESNNTVTVQFRDAALNLKVTPHITSANTIVMDVSLENGAPDFGHTVNGNPSINTQKANTRVMVADGVTTVIGGVVVNQEFANDDKTPGLGNIPLLGWLFKSSSHDTENQEILIFITPRILRGVS